MKTQLTRLFLLFAVAGLILKPAPLAAELIGYYPFDNASDPRQDASGKGNNLQTADADPTHDPAGGFSGGAYLFDGSQRLIVPIDINVAVLPQLTMGAWVKTSLLTPALRKVMGHDDGGWDRTIGLDDRNGPFRYTSFSGSGPVEGTPGPKSTEDWTFLAAAYDDFSQEVTVYVDIDATTVGDELAAVTVPATFGFGFETASIGNLRPDNASEGWQGSIDNAFLFDQVLTPEQLTAMRNAGTPATNVQVDPNLSVVSVPDLSSLPKTQPTHTISIPIRNDGAAMSLSLSNVIVTGADSNHYTVASFPAQLNAGQSNTIEVTFNPQGQVSNFQARLEIRSNDPIQGRATLDLSANVVPDGTSDPLLSVVTPDPIFGDLGSVSGSVERSVAVRNAGAAQTLNLAAASVVGTDATNYTVVSFPPTIAPGQTGTVVVAFDPRGQQKTFAANLRLTSNDAQNRLKLVDIFARVTGAGPRTALLGFYPFDDANEPLRDESGSGNNLTQPEGAEPVHDAQGGFEGGAFQFDGSQRTVAPININPTALPEVTMGAWVRTTNLDPGLRKVMGHDDGGWDRTIGLDNREPDLFRYAAFVGNGPPSVGLPGPENDQDWTFFAASFSQPLNQVSVYVDLDARTTNDPLLSITQPTGFGSGFSTFSIGSLRPDNVNEGWQGSIDNAFVYGIALSAQQLQAIRDGGKAKILETETQPPRITSTSLQGGQLMLTWSSQAAANYAVQYSETLPATWTQIGTQASQGASTSFTDSDATRLGRPQGYYRVAQQP